MLGDDTPIPEHIIEAVRAAGVPFHRSPERALRAIKRYSDWVQTAKTQPVATAARGARLASGMIVEHAAKDILQADGLAMPPRALARTKDEALAAVAKVGFPLVMKIQSPQAPHKSDIGGVMLNIRDEATLSQRWDEMQAIIADKLPGADIHGVLLESMAEPGMELILGARNDPQWGALIAVGMGGVEAEVTHDIRHLTPESTLEEIEASLGKLKRAALFGPFRGRQPRDLKAVAKAVQQVGQFMQAHPEVRELDVNPLTVLAEGRGAVALDVLMVCD
jgi:acyl-CoA synthetase (NDP forming)